MAAFTTEQTEKNRRFLLLREMTQSERIANVFFNLHERWQDEKEYEDIADYAAPLQSVLPAECVIEKMTKRPFGCKLAVRGAPFKLFLTPRGTIRVESTDPRPVG
jgi:hypothetical protein